MSEIGHNSGATNIAVDEVRLLVERIERIEEDQKNLADDKKDVYLEAKSRGYDAKALRKIVAIRKIIEKPGGKEKYDAEQANLQVYLDAFGIE